MSETRTSATSTSSTNTSSTSTPSTSTSPDRLSRAPNLNRYWADLVVEELVRSGVELFCISPGSRSTPLTAAVAAHPRARHVLHFDERGSAFFALGYGRATRRPAAWITTSGTAVANGLPAVVEASTDGVPMVLLTADRPPELRETGANQTIDQVKLFGDYVRWFFDLPTPMQAIDPAMVLTTVDQAVHRALRDGGGPVHLNGMFREPLAPTPDGEDVAAYAGPLASWERRSEPFTTHAASVRTPAAAAVRDVAARLRGVERGLVVAGRLDTPEEAEAVRQLADGLGWPLLADVGSQGRLGARRAVPAFFDHVLGSEAFRQAQTPQAVVHVGGRATSKRLLQYLEACRPSPYVVVHPRASRYDPTHQVTHRIDGDVAASCEQLVGALEGPTEAHPGWTQAWLTASDRAADVLARWLDGAEALTEPVVARLVTRLAREGDGLVLASSMPVRDVDMLAPADGPRLRVAANRGASGIDGLVSTAAGFAEGLGRPVTLLIGDLALLHDLNALHLVKERPVRIVVLNNDGGGIFHFLPIAEHPDVFEPFFTTPHGLSFESAAAMFGLHYHRAMTPDGFADAFAEAGGRERGTLIEVVTDREANRALHQQLLGDVVRAVDQP